MYQKNIIGSIFVGIALFFLSSCQTGNPEPTASSQTAVAVQTSAAEKELETEPTAQKSTPKPTAEPTIPAADERCCDVFRIGIYEEPASLNYWNYLGPGSSVWTGYIIGNDAAHLFTLAGQQYQFVPSLALDIPSPQPTEDGSWEIVVEMIPAAVWSDGAPITAQDVEFTIQVCQDLQLTHYWADLCRPEGTNIEVVAQGEYQVKYTFRGQAPTLKTWQFGIALAPILPKHYWQDIVSEAQEMIRTTLPPLDDRPAYCAALKLTPSEQSLCDSWATYDDVYEQARQHLYSHDVQDYPVAGGYKLADWLPGELIRLVPNDEYYFRDTLLTGYRNGTWTRQFVNGMTNTLYGEPASDPLWQYQDQAFSPGLDYVIFGSQEAALKSLGRGDIDYVLNPIGLTPPQIDELRNGEHLVEITNSANEMFYLAFNTQKYPLSTSEFRQVFDILLDREWIITEVSTATLQPLYSSVLPENTFWHNPDIVNPYQKRSRQERVTLAVQVLKDAGWVWKTEPAWDAAAQAILPGDGLTMPTGDPMPEITILGPGPEFDFVRATFTHRISEWARDLGIPVQSELTDRNAILDAVFVAADYDLYIFGTSLGNPAYPGYFETFWHSSNCTLETGGLNTSCFKNAEFDILAEAFEQANDLENGREYGLQMQKMLADQRPFIPLYTRAVTEFVAENVNFPYTKILNGIEYQNGFQTGVQVLLPEK